MAVQPSDVPLIIPSGPFAFDDDPLDIKKARRTPTPPEVLGTKGVEQSPVVDDPLQKGNQTEPREKAAGARSMLFYAVLFGAFSAVAHALLKQYYRMEWMEQRLEDHSAALVDHAAALSDHSTTIIDLQETTESIVAGGVPMIDYAQSSAGSTVIWDQTSSTYKPFALYWPWAAPSPRSSPARVLEPGGDPWCLGGSSGQIAIDLRRDVHASFISLDYPVRKTVVKASAAPKMFEVWLRCKGERSAYDIVFNKSRPQGVWCLEFGGAFDFALKDDRIVTTYPLAELWRSQNATTSGIIFWFRSNWGDPSQTCIFRLRLHP